MGKRQAIVDVSTESPPVRAQTVVVQHRPFVLQGYRIGEMLHDGAHAVVYRGTRERDGQTVILKVLLDRALTAGNIAQLRHEHQILERINGAGAVRAHGFAHDLPTVALITEDIGGVALRSLIDRRALPFGKKLEIALSLVAALRGVHAAHVIHKDLCPQNVVINPATGELRLIDFDLATALPIERTCTAIPTLLQGTLAYIAPEQTGRMNRAVDYRSDFYALGVTLYELFTDQLPFLISDTLELIHAHIARQPLPPNRINREIPEAISNIVLKLLAKTAEDRYQSIWSLEADLQECLKQWQASGAVAPFPIDQLQICDRFRVPQKLYGRAAEVDQLLGAFDRASTGQPEALFIHGPSGIGKTSLVREVYKPITAKRGYFASGKFDQLQRNIPYSAVVAALGELIRQFLSESEEDVARWQRRLQAAVGDNGRVLTDLLPNLELIIGKQPPVPVLPEVQTQERLALLMRKFFIAVCRPEHPLALYLDDLQWADSASLALLLQILPDPELKFFLLIASYRDNEVDAAHPVILEREKLKRHSVRVTDVQLQPLHVEHIQQLVVDALRAASEEAQPLAALVHEKTGGNPFFVDEFLKNLYSKELLQFDGPQRRWRWNLETIRTEAVTDNIVSLMTENISQLPHATQHLLRLAACIGSSFDTRTLVLAAGQSAARVMSGLHDAASAGFIQPLDDAYRWAGSADAQEETNVRFRFAHDRVQQAAYELIDPDQRRRLHYRIGKLLLESGSEQARDLFEIVNQLNLGREEAPPEQRTKLAELNLSAGKQAKAAAVYDIALNYFKTGVELLGERGWTEHYDLALALYTGVVQVAPLSSAPTEQQACFETICRHARTALDQIPAFEAKIAAQSRCADYRAAAETGIEALRLLGVRFPSNPTPLHIFFSEWRGRLALAPHTPESLLNHRQMTDPTRIAESRILLVLCQLFFWSNQDLLNLAVYRFRYLCAWYGNSNEAPYVYASYAMRLYTAGQIDKGYRYARLALTLLDKLDNKELRPLVSCLVQVTRHWKESVQKAREPILDVYRQALEVGDLNTAGAALLHSVLMPFYLGEPLPSLQQAAHSCIETLERSVKETKSRGALELFDDAFGYLTGAPSRYFFKDASSDEARAAEQKRPSSFHFLQTMLAYHFGDYTRAHRHAEISAKSAYMTAGMYRLADFYSALAGAMVHPTLPLEAQAKNKKNIRQIRERYRLLARHSPDNYAHKSLLLEAEYARLTGRQALAESLYDQAIETAGQTGHVHEEALAAELAGRHYLDGERTRVAQTYLREARRLYARWGATRKVEWLEHTYANLHLGGIAERSGHTTISTHSGTRAALNVDLPALMKALKAIAEENIHSQILKKTIEIVMQFAGADKALLLLRHGDDELRIEADMDASRAEPQLLKGIPIRASHRLSENVVNYARRVRSSVVIHNAAEPQSVIPGLQNDPYVRNNGVKSILCIPFTVGTDRENEVIGLLYAENNKATNAFTERRVETLELICLSVAGRLELSRKAITDSLTGLYNRAYFQSALQKEYALARLWQRSTALVMVDIDHFKQINDTYGHQVGDAVLQRVAQILKESCRESDVAARYGGEEMAVILTETNSDQALDVAERIRETLEKEAFRNGDVKFRVTASLGVAGNAAMLNDPDALVKAADEALYRSKGEGRNRVTVAL